MPHVALELKELRTLPHPGIHPLAPQTPNAEGGCRNWQRSGRAGWGGGLGWGRGDRGPALPRARPRWEDAHRVRGPAGAQPRRLPSLSLTRGPAASAQPSPPASPSHPPPPASCPRRPGVEAAQRPPEPGRGGGPGRGGPRSAPSSSLPPGPTSSPPPLTGSAPGRDAQEACCFAR